MVETTSGVVTPVLSASFERSSLDKSNSALNKSDYYRSGVPETSLLLSFTDVTEHTLSTFIVEPGGSLVLLCISFLCGLDASILSEGVATWRPPSRESITPGRSNLIVLTPFEFLDG